MKKFLLAIALFTTSISIFADDKVSISADELKVKPGQQEVELNINMTNSIDIIGFSFHIATPDGISIFKDSEGYYVIETDRWPTSRNKLVHTMDIQDVEGTTNTIQVSGYHATTPFKDNSGDIVKIYLNVSNDFAAETANVKIDAISFSDQDSASHGQDAFDITVKNDEADGIEAVVVTTNDNTNQFNLMGQRVNANSKGIIVSNGKKFIAK